MDIINIIEDNSTIVSVGTYGNVVVDIPTSNIIMAGALGPQGPSGESTIAGSPILITDLQSNDLISYNGLNWINRRQEIVTEGGNF